jgi:hypothetical protein
MKNIIWTAFLIALATQAAAQGGPPGAREEAYDALSNMTGRDHAWRSSAEDVLRLMHRPGFLKEYMERPDSFGSSNVDELRRSRPGLETRGEGPPLPRREGPPRGEGPPLPPREGPPPERGAGPPPGPK